MFEAFFRVIYKSVQTVIIYREFGVHALVLSCSYCWQLLEPFDAAEAVEHICRALKHHEVNWKSLLSLTAVTLTTCHDATRHLQSTLFFVPLPFFKIS